MNRKLLWIGPGFVLVLILLLLARPWHEQEQEQLPRPAAEFCEARPTQTAYCAFLNHQSDIQVAGVGAVIRILADDREGSRHQRFILQTADGQTLLVAHNIDLAPRIENLRLGDRVAFFGEYVWNDQGGVIHWTHHDPAGRHVAGWLEHQGRTYQ